MHRPTRQYANLLKKIEEKKARSRTSGKKVKRWKKWAETYKELCKDEGDKTSGAKSSS